MLYQCQNCCKAAARGERPRSSSSSRTQSLLRIRRRRRRTVAFSATANIMQHLLLLLTMMSMLSMIIILGADGAPASARRSFLASFVVGGGRTPQQQQQQQNCAIRQQRQQHRPAVLVRPLSASPSLQQKQATRSSSAAHALFATSDSNSDSDSDRSSCGSNSKSWKLLTVSKIRGGAGSDATTKTAKEKAATTTEKATNAPPTTVLQYNASRVDAGGCSMAELWRRLRAHPDEGLSQAEAAARLQTFGRNALQATPTKSLWKLIAEQFQDSLVQILVAVAVLSALFSVAEVLQADPSDTDSLWNSFVEPAVIVAILIGNAAVGVWQTRSASDSLAALEKLQAAVCTVIRDHRTVGNLPADQLVPGDVVELRTGDKVPADGRLIRLQSSVLAVDEGPLTGESTTVFKLPGDEGTTRPTASNGNGNGGGTAALTDQRGMLYAGTMVTRGAGRLLVTATGMETEFGKIQRGVAAARADQPKTPLAIRLDEFGQTLTVIIGVICLGVWIVSIPKMNDPSFASPWEGAVYYAKVAVALGVAAIPEGLPAVITLCLSLGTRRMAQRNVIVRNLPSVETLGCTSVICTDKTGTLTTNEMTAVRLVVLEHTRGGDPVVAEHAVEGYSYSPAGRVDGIPGNREVREQPLGAVADVAAVSALCNDARILGHDGNGENDDDDDDRGSDGMDKGMKVVEERVDATGKGTLTEPPHGKKDRRRRKKKKAGSSDTEKTYERVGEPTEAALCVLAEKLGGMSHFLEGPHLDRHGLHFNVPPSVLASANVQSWRELHPRLATLEFSRDRKSMSVLCDFPKGSYPPDGGFHGGGRPRKKGNRLLVKGAPNLLIERCTHVKFRDGTVSKMTAELRRAIEAKVTDLAARPLRCLALAVKDTGDLEGSLRKFAPADERDVAKHPLLADSANYRNIESGLTLVGVVGIKDPARPGVAESIDECTQAGIRVLMITGDAKDTAVAIARDVRIFPPADSIEAATKPLKAFQGREFFNKPIEEQLEIIKSDNIVFCRAEPADKQKLVKMLQSFNEIVAMTGDGVNDAPALQQAAIGVAMGITGTEVSKEASDMILADDNFSTIVNAVEEGRRIYANMQAFICFLISCNIGEICAIFFATLAGFPEPLTAMHLLWVNLVTDGPPATALGFNPPAPDLMEAPPRPSDEPIMTKWLLTRYCLTGLYVGLATIGVFAQHYLDQGITLAQLASWSQCGEFWSPGEGVASCTELFQGSGRMLPQTLALTTLVCMEMFKALSAVSVDSSIFRVGPQSNRWLLLGVSGPVLLHLFVLYSPNFGLGGLGESFGMVPLTLDNWVTVLGWAAPILLVDEILKAIGRYIYREERKEKALRRYSK